MSTFRLEIITAERQVFADDVNVVVAPGIEGELGILPHHAPLMTMLNPGELLIRKDGEEIYLAVSGGFLEVRPDKVIILADACERAEEIDIERAEQAKRRAEKRLRTHPPELDASRAEAALRRSLARLKVVERRRRKLKSDLGRGHS
ncbi:MAG TPA: F0F1 ATP synthase subunit epsilon [Dehalococcoidia bacterium]|nr:F0F1 ATP synthase subunit epsilon [Dehalococcoidia bacterium]